MTKNLILSLFSGIDGLGIGFEREGYCVVRGPEKILGGDVRDFHAVKGFEGIIGGPPCQDFSKLNRSPSGNSLAMLGEFCRVVREASPDWFLIENDLGVPDVEVEGYQVQRFNLDYAWFSEYSRNRAFQFGSKKGVTLNPMQGRKGKVIRTALTCGEKMGAEAMRDIQGFGRDHKLPCMTHTAKKTAYGNAVPVPMAHYVAKLIRAETNGKSLRSQTTNVCDRPSPNVCDRGPPTFELSGDKRCKCGCGRILVGRQRAYASGTCRWREHDRRKKQGTTKAKNKA